MTQPVLQAAHARQRLLDSVRLQRLHFLRGHRLHRRPLLGRGRTHGVVKPLDQHPLVRPLDRRERPGQAPGGVGQHRTVGGVGVAVHGVRLQLDVEQPLHAQRDLGHALPGDAAALPDAGVGGQQPPLLRHKLLHLRAADLLVPLDAELHGAGQLAANLLPGPQRRQPGGDIPLVVGDAAPVQLALPQRRLKRRRRPQLQRLRRLHVVMVVEQQRPRRPTRLLRIDDGVPALLRQHPRLEPQIAQEARHMLRRLLDRRVLGADRR